MNGARPAPWLAQVVALGSVAGLERAVDAGRDLSAGFIVVVREDVRILISVRDHEIV